MKKIITPFAAIGVYAEAGIEKAALLKGGLALKF